MTMDLKTEARFLSKCWGWLCGLALFVLVQGSSSYAQQLPPEVERMGYADTIFINGKIVSMDDGSASADVGNIYQALAVKGDQIMKLGTNQEIRALAGRITRVLDLKGRTLIPGIIESHQHIYGRSLRWLDRFGIKYPPNGIIIEPQAEPDLERTQAVLRDSIKEAVTRINPGERILTCLSNWGSGELPGV
jgi:hypothetical protein